MIYKRIIKAVIVAVMIISLTTLPQNKITFSVKNFMAFLPAKYKKKQRGPDPRPSDWGWMQRVFPYGTADKTAHIEAIQQAQRMRSNLSLPATSMLATVTQLNAIPWQFAGPENIGGRISDIEYNPVNPDIVYAGAATGGVFKSGDGGYTWRPVFDEQAVLSVGDIAVDPVNPNIVYVGTGEANGGHNNFPGAGVYKSENAGETWRLIGLEYTASIGRIVIDPANTNRIYVAAAGSYFGPDADRGVYRSTDGGATWNKSLFVSDSTGAIDLIINPENPSILHAAMWERVRRPERSHLYGYSSGIYRSTNRGNSWTRLGAIDGLPENDRYIGRIGLALCESEPEIIYALYTDYKSNIGYGYRACYRSTDGGLTWLRVDPGKSIAMGTGTFSWYFGNIRVHPKDPWRVYAMDVSFMRSEDGGDSWPIIYGYGNPFPDFHVDHHALAFHPFHPDTLLNGNDGGINISHDSGVSWTKVDLLPVTQFYEITMDQSNPQRLYGGTQDNGTLRTLSGRTDDWEPIYGGDGFFVIVDPVNPNILYAEAQFGYLGKSTNGGTNFRSVLNGINSEEPTNWSTPVVMDPNNHLVLYYGTNRIYQTRNGADSWVVISPDLSKGLPTASLGTVTSIAVAASNSNVIYAGTDDGNVWVTKNDGESWTDVTHGLPYRWVTRITVDPANEAIAYVTFSGLKWKSPQPHVFRTADMGESWQDISNNLPDAPVNAILVDPVYSNLLYLGSDVGCYFSPDYGGTWYALGAELPVVPVYSMDIHRVLRRLVIGTHGRSMYVMDLEGFIPVELSSFVAEVHDKNVLLKWRTESETNNLGFDIEHKPDDGGFISIGFIRGAGSTAIPQQYEFRDANLTAGIHFYRLRQTDQDGTFHYSRTLRVNINAPEQFQLSQNYPNPFNSSTVIGYRVSEKSRVGIRIYNTLGQQIVTLIDEEHTPGIYQGRWDVTDAQGDMVPGGLYLCQMETKGFSSMKRMIYVK